MGPDEIAPDLLKHLPAEVEVELLKILNHSWLEGWCPQFWRDAVIIPFLKRDKDPQSVDSYRPIALTSTICKLLERMIVNRLSWWLEKHSLLSLWQAGFRKGRSTVDQCLRLSQHISDGFQSSERLRTGMTLFDSSKAMIGSGEQIYCKRYLGIPARFLVWISSWLTNRQARVRVNAKVGRSRTFKEGLPQGSVLSPLFFVIYINDLFMKFEDTTLVSAYADDLTIACSGRSKIDMREASKRS